MNTGPSSSRAWLVKNFWLLAMLVNLILLLILLLVLAALVASGA